MTNSDTNGIAIALSSLAFSAAAPGCGSDNPATDTNSSADASAMTDSGTHVSLDAGVTSLDAARPSHFDAAVCADQTDAGVPLDLFCTGLYVDGDPTRFADGVAPYTPGITFWSDGAQKQRYFYLPPGTKIDTSNFDYWKFPVGTKAWKEFRLNGALVETRLFWKNSDSDWAAVTYIWDAHGEHATLNMDRKGIILPNGYEIPTDRDCLKCHHGGSDRLLGIEAVALSLPTAMGVTLTSLTAAGSLSVPRTPTTMALPEDSTGKAAAALGYLHVNCGVPCHSARGLGDETKLVLRIRADELWPVSSARDAGTQDAGGHDAGAAPPVPATVTTTDIYRATYKQTPTTASVMQKFPDAVRITPGSHDKSLVWVLAHTRGNYQMPPLVSHLVDDVGTQKLADWIDALAP
ncbi:MAG TPA: hypothetical protein VG963_27590 [Polyangiaceae bacterium]|nr:hypothetical protein [Polyangiaceae bacterium]